MVCKKCNAQLPEDVKFCSYCGEKIEANTAEEQVAVSEQTEEVQQEQPQTAEEANDEVKEQETQNGEENKEEVPQEIVQENLQQDAKKEKETKNDEKRNKIITTKKLLVGAAICFVIAVVVVVGWNVLKGKDTKGSNTQRAQSKSGQDKATTQTSTDTSTDAITAAPTATPLSFENKIIRLNETGNPVTEIDIYKENYQVRQAEEGDYWDNRMFDELEGAGEKWGEPALLDTYNKEAKTLRNKQTGNMIEYILYRNPDTNKVNKIVSIEELENGEIETVDYYFTDEGKVDFIFFHTVTEYTPSYATQDKPGERYYFDNDAMTKWRVVPKVKPKEKKHTYVVTKKELGNNKKDKKWSMLQDASTEIQNQFHEKAVRMLNAAYNTYHAVVDTESINLIDGCVVDEYDETLADVTVRLFAEEKEECLFECSTDENGKYQLYIPSDVYTYRLEIEKEGFLKEVIYGIEPTGEIVELIQERVCLFQDGEKGNMYFELKHAFDKVYISEATITIRKGVNNRYGDIYDVFDYMKDENTEVSLEPGNYTLEIQSADYQTAYKDIRFSMEEGITILLSPALKEGEVRIVLDWGAYPEDLDAHLFTPFDKEESEDSYHIWYGQLEDPYGNKLDIDQQEGFGPETMTIKNLGDGCYKYYVADFTHCNEGDPSSYEMSDSGAQVNVYTSDGEVQTFYVPTNHSGVIWEVFEIRNGRINRINHYYNQIEDKPWWSQEK